MFKKKQTWAVVVDDPALGPLISSTHRTQDQAISARRFDDWLVMPEPMARDRQHDWMQDPERWRAVARKRQAMDDLKTDLVIAKSSVASTYQPVSSGDGIDGPLLDAMQEVRVRLSGIGRVRPRLLPSGQTSSSEFEIGMTVHDARALLSVLPERIGL